MYDAVDKLEIELKKSEKNFKFAKRLQNEILSTWIDNLGKFIGPIALAGICFSILNILAEDPKKVEQLAVGIEFDSTRMNNLNTFKHIQVLAVAASFTCPTSQLIRLAN
jgi:hypothetical protein